MSEADLVSQYCSILTRPTFNLTTCIDYPGIKRQTSDVLFRSLESSNVNGLVTARAQSRGFGNMLEMRGLICGVVGQGRS